MVGECSLPLPHGVVSVLPMRSVSLFDLSSLLALASAFSDSPSDSSEKPSSAAAAAMGALIGLLLASAFSCASTLSGEPGGGASGAGSMVAIGVGPNSGTLALAIPDAPSSGVGL